MNPIIEVLINQEGTDEIIYKKVYYESIKKSILVIYSNGYRIKVNQEEFILYFSDPNDGFYVPVLENETGLDTDEYFNLSIQYGLNDICLKNNIDIIRKILDTVEHGTHIIELKRS